MTKLLKKLFHFHRWQLVGSTEAYGDKAVTSRVWRECPTCGEKRQPTNESMGAVQQIHATMQAKHFQHLANIEGSPHSAR